MTNKNSKIPVFHLNHRPANLRLCSRNSKNYIASPAMTISVLVLLRGDWKSQQQPQIHKFVLGNTPLGRQSDETQQYVLSSSFLILTL